MTRGLSTFTLGDDSENPVVSLCRGHVNLPAFQRALENEGWDGDSVSTVSHEWWRKLKAEAGVKWEKTEKDADGALPVTVSYW